MSQPKLIYLCLLNGVNILSYGSVGILYITVSINTVPIEISVPNFVASVIIALANTLLILPKFPMSRLEAYNVLNSLGPSVAYLRG